MAASSAAPLLGPTAWRESRRPSAEATASHRSDCVAGFMRYTAAPSPRPRSASPASPADDRTRTAVRAQLGRRAQTRQPIETVHLTASGGRGRRGTPGRDRALEGGGATFDRGGSDPPMSQHLDQDTPVRGVAVHDESGQTGQAADVEWSRGGGRVGALRRIGRYRQSKGLPWPSSRFTPKRPPQNSRASGTPRRASKASSRPFWWESRPSALRAWLTRSWSEKLTRSSSTRPASIFEKSRISLITPRRGSADDERASVRYSRCSGSARSCR